MGGERGGESISTSFPSSTGESVSVLIDCVSGIDSDGFSFSCLLLVGGVVCPTDWAESP